MKTEVSVMMVVHNGEKTVVHAIESVLNQRFFNFEFIIVDDGSSDNTLKMLTTFTDERIRILRNCHNYTESLNIGMKNAKGKYIARMDADDYMHPERLHFQWAFMENHTDIDICSTWMQTYGLLKKVVSRYSGKMEDMAYRLLLGNFICHPTVMMRTEKIRKHILQYENYAMAEDYKLWLESAKKGLSFYIIPLVLHYYRTSSDQQTTKYKEVQINTSRRIKEEALEFLIQNQGNQSIKRYLEETVNLYKIGFFTLEQICKIFILINDIAKKHEI